MKNRLKKLPPEFRKALNVVSQQAQLLGINIYLVGGIVRDLILGREHFDLDIVVEGDAISLCRRVAEYLNVYFNKHHAFGTATVYFENFKMDFATARSEYYSSWGNLPKVKPASLREDLFRRDFTINAMAISLNRNDYGKLIDFYNGLFDLKQGLIRVLHRNSFLDDPTRVLRAVRFEQRFYFKIEKHTFSLMKDALRRGALQRVHPHRWRDELILILGEIKPYRYIKRMENLSIFSFIEPTIKLHKKDFRLLLRIERAVALYKKEFKNYRELERWILYLSAILIKLPKKDILRFLDKFAFKKRDRVRIISIKESLSKMNILSKKLKPHRIYRIINHLSFESIVFFYAYYPHKVLRKNIKYFLNNLVGIRLKIKGDALRTLGIVPRKLYSKILERVLYAKIDRNFMSAQEELREVKHILKKLSKKH
jgi:tRNA nucleotidyltransferase (CCA-adding enzyme)